MTEKYHSIRVEVRLYKKNWIATIAIQFNDTVKSNLHLLGLSTSNTKQN